MTHSESIKGLATALAKAQGEMGALLKDKENPYFKSKYADLAAVWDACRDALSSNGLAVIQAPAFDPEHPDHVCMDTVLTHASGEWLVSRSAMKMVKTDPQTMLATLTYLRRGVLQSIVGLAAEDDDGNAASGRDARVPAAAAKVAAAAAKVAPPAPRTRATPAAERTPPAPPEDTRGAQPHGTDNATLRPMFYIRAGACGLSDAQAGAIAKAATGKASSSLFDSRDWDIAFGQLDMRDRWLAFAKTRGYEGEEATNWAGEVGFPWDAKWDARAFQTKYDATVK